ncbi:MAG: Crp/Fnr family transcriptional regulator [Trueperaceae bacterium]|nr:MAG: Crp/Fnr family transcriptional regulator [Trueperaceae bacterium]
MLSTIERVLFLKGADLFSNIDSEDLVPVAQVAEELHFEAGEAFIRQGELGDCLYLLVDGTVDIVIQGVGVVAQREPKSVIGEMAILSRQPRTADCIAKTDVTALKIGYHDFWELLAEKPPLALGVIKVLAQRLDEAVANLKKLTSAGAQPQGEGSG